MTQTETRPETVNYATESERLHLPLPDEELRLIGGACVEAMTREAFVRAAKGRTVDINEVNPNKISPGFFIGKPEHAIPTDSNMAYRSVDRRALEDLVETGVVQGAFEATNGKRANTNGVSTFWSQGVEGSVHGFTTPGHAIIETTVEDVKAGVIRTDQITAIHALDDEGNVRDITKI